jgi:predicted DsbA family dithiol-disulfide isomerase
VNAAEAAPLTVDVVSDVVCPWCFIGKRRLEKAIEAAGLPVAVRWRPYQLDPTIPPEGKSRRDYFEAKFGSSERIRQIHERVAETGRGDGIDFAFEAIAVAPNTLDAHRLVRWAGDADVQDLVMEALFRGYFLEGRNVGDHDVLAGIAEVAGMDGGTVRARLASDEDRNAVRAEIDAAQQMGVTGVPTFILAGRYALVGAQPAEEVADALSAVAARLNGAAAARN